MKSTKKGFTLIELLVVIAIIGILSSIVLIALRGARDKAKDARIIADLSQIRSIAEMLYDGDYDDLDLGDLTDCVSDGTGDADVDKIAEDVCVQLGTTTPILTIAQSGDDYCAYSALNEGGYYCIDSSGVAEETDTNPGGEGYCIQGATYVCP